MDKDLWLKQFDWHLQRRALITAVDAGVDDNFTQKCIESGMSPEEAAVDLIQDGGLDDVVENPWVGPSEEYWREWKRKNPFPDKNPAGYGRSVSRKTIP